MNSECLREQTQIHAFRLQHGHSRLQLCLVRPLVLRRKSPVWEW